MAKLTAQQVAEVRSYERPTLDLVRQLTAGMRHAGALMSQVGERGDDTVWQAQMIAECRSWRALLDALPGEAPAVYAATHARILRWAAAVAEAGDDYAAAIEQRDDVRLAIASRKMLEIPSLYLDVTRAVQEVVTRMRA